MSDKTKPNYYKNDLNTLDVIDIVKILNLNFNLGNVLKYITRAGKKDNVIQDLQKAREYIDREIIHLKTIGND